MRRINYYFPNVTSGIAFGLITSAITSFVPFYQSDVFPLRRRFEKETQKRIGIGYTIATSANRSALYALFSALNISKGDEIIITGYTCLAVVEPVLLLGAIPIYIDIEPETFCLDINLLESKISTRTRVIILQHTYGFSGAIDKVMEIARRHGVFVIEDCALALGSNKGRRWLGTFGNAAVWSFELSKTISVGWGGLIGINNDKALALRVSQIIDNEGVQPPFLAGQRLFQGGLSGLLYHHRAPRLLRKYGLMGLFRFHIFKSSAETTASDMRMPADRQWKYLLIQFQRLESILDKSKTIQGVYEKILSNHGCVSPSLRHAGPETVLIRFPLLVEDPQRFIDYFAKKDIEVGRWFSSPVSGAVQPLTCYGYQPGCCPVAEYVCRHIVNLPLNGRLNDDLVNLIAETLNQYLSDHPEEITYIQRFSSQKTIKECR